VLGKGRKKYNYEILGDSFLTRKKKGKIGENKGSCRIEAEIWSSNCIWLVHDLWRLKGEVAK